MHPMLNIAIRASRKAGNLIVKYYDIPYENSNVNKDFQKEINDFITHIDIKIEQLMIEVIRKSYPKHTILGKESGKLVGENTYVQWIINPLNGTSNFNKRFPHFAVSIAVHIKGRTEVAVVYDPIRNELFTASRGYGAQLNGYRLRVNNSIRNLDGTILATKFSIKKEQSDINYFTLTNKLLVQCVSFRCTGSIALDLAYVAAGRIDGFFEQGLKPYDFVGGELLVREAGGLVTDFAGSQNQLLSGDIIAGSSYIVKALLSSYIQRSK